MVSAGAVTGLVLSLASTAPASAATFFYAQSDTVFASLMYHYNKCDNKGYCHIEVTEIKVRDEVEQDHWGAVLTMHRKTPPGTPEVDDVDIASVPDEGGERRGGPISRNNQKDVWFEVCNWRPGTIDRPGCVRLHK